VKSIRHAYREFLNTQHGANVYRCFKRILYSTDDSLVRALDEAVLPRTGVCGRDAVRLSDIGGGDGERVCGIVDRLHARFRNAFELDFIEQSGIYTQDFARRRKPFCLTTHVHHALFEDVSLPSEAYDVVLLIHSIFAFANGAATKKVLGLLRPDGYAIVVSNASDSFLAGLKRLVDAGFGDARYEINDLSRSLNALGVSYSTETFETSWEIEDQTWNDAIAVILDWISLGRFAHFDEAKKREIETYVLDSSIATRRGRAFREKEIVLVVPPLSA
jgi:hypothetical protein